VDNDHCAGLVGVMERFEVKHLWMNRPLLYVDHVLDGLTVAGARLLSGAQVRAPALRSTEGSSLRKGSPPAKLKRRGVDAVDDNATRVLLTAIIVAFLAAVSLTPHVTFEPCENDRRLPVDLVVAAHLFVKTIEAEPEPVGGIRVSNPQTFDAGA
jgi:hypothetical protein